MKLVNKKRKDSDEAEEEATEMWEMVLRHWESNDYVVRISMMAIERKENMVLRYHNHLHSTEEI